MNRRQAIRFAVSFAFASALGKYDALAQAPRSGRLTVDLNQWRDVVFTFGKDTITIPVADVFKALKEGPG